MTKKFPGPDDSLTKQRYNTHLTQMFSENGGGRNSFSEPFIILIPNLTKAFLKKGKYLPISHMNRDAKIFNKILAHEIQKYI